MSDFRITKKVLMVEVENFNTTFNVEPKLKLFNSEGSCYSLFQGKSLLFEGNASETHIFLGGFHKGFQKCLKGTDNSEKSKETKQGVWIKKLYRNYITPPCEEYECSVCHKKVFFTEDVCPYCFSEMTDIVADD